MPRSSQSPSYLTSRRWTESEARAALAAVAASGLTPREFAAREGLDHQRFYAWQRKLSKPVREAASPAFIEVRPSAAEVVEVVLRSGVVLRVRESIDASVLERLVSALDGKPC
jgi:transposase-like protein